MLVDNRGFKTSAGHLRRQALNQLLSAYSAESVEHPELAALLSSAAQVRHLLAPLWSPKRALHPLVALLLIEALRQKPEVNPQLHLWGSARKRSLQALEHSLERFVTATQCAQDSQVSTTTAVVHALAAGKEVKLRPKKLTRTTRQTIVVMLEKAYDVQEVVRQVGLSTSSVYRVMKATPRLAEHYRAARRADQLRDCQNHWEQLQTTHPTASKSRLRQLAPGCYSFLYRSCRSWLGEHSPAKFQQAGVGTPRPRVPCGADAALAQAIRNAAQTGGGRRRYTATGLLEAAGKADGTAPSLRAAPLTRIALEACVEDLPAFVRRRLIHAVEVLTRDGQRPASWKVVRTSSLRPQTIHNSCVDPQELVALARERSFVRLADGQQ